MAGLPITDAEIRQHTTGGSYDRGHKYRDRGAVTSLEHVASGKLKASVQGSDVHPYVVQIEFDSESIASVECSCPYVEGSWCKHIVATLLQALTSESIPKTEPVAIAELVRDLDRQELVALLQQLADDDPDLVDRIERVSVRLAENG